jgi:predicted site-specific integrase-resolvase
MPTLTDTPEMSALQVAIRLGISTPTVKRWGLSGVIRYRSTVLGRLYDRDDVDRLARERAQRQGPRPPEAA